MKNKILLFVGLALITGLIGGYAVSQSKLVSKMYEDAAMQQNKFGGGLGSRDGNQTGKDQPNRENCLADDCLLVDDLEYPAGELPQNVQQALNEAINDEYKALTTYQAVVEEFGNVRPFSMIIGAEKQHIASLKAVFDKYGLEIPENTWINSLSAPSTLKEACQTGVDAEIANAALYKDELLPTVENYEDITGVFVNLMNASQQKHLPAFDRCD